jgi:hypothetical protein
MFTILTVIKDFLAAVGVLRVFQEFLVGNYQLGQGQG